MGVKKNLKQFILAEEYQARYYVGDLFIKVLVRGVMESLEQDR